MDRCDSLEMPSSVASITPSRRAAASASSLFAMRSAVALSVVLAHFDRRVPVWSNH